MGGMVKSRDVQHDWSQNESSPGPLAAYGLSIYGLVRGQALPKHCLGHVWLLEASLESRVWRCVLLAVVNSTARCMSHGEREAHAHEVQAYEAHTHKVQTHEMHAHEVHALRDTRL